MITKKAFRQIGLRRHKNIPPTKLTTKYPNKTVIAMIHPFGVFYATISTYPSPAKIEECTSTRKTAY